MAAPSAAPAAAPAAPQCLRCGASLGDPVCATAKKGDKYCTGHGLMPDLTMQYCTQAPSSGSHMILYLGIGGGLLLVLLFLFVMMRGHGH